MSEPGRTGTATDEHRRSIGARPAAPVSESRWPSLAPAELAANGALSLLNVCCYLLDRQLAAQLREGRRLHRTAAPDKNREKGRRGMTRWSSSRREWWATSAERWPPNSTAHGLQFKVRGSRRHDRRSLTRGAGGGQEMTAEADGSIGGRRNWDTAARAKSDA